MKYKPPYGSLPYLICMQELARERAEADEARAAAVDRQQLQVQLNAVKHNESQKLAEFTSRHNELDTKCRLLQEEVCTGRSARLLGCVSTQFVLHVFSGTCPAA